MTNYVRWGPTIAANTQTAGDQLKPSTIGLNDGSFLVFWQTSSTADDGSGSAVKGQRFTATGVPTGAEFLVNGAAAGNQTIVRAAALASGNLVVTWETADPTQDGSGTAVKAQMFSAAGAKIGSEFLVNTLTYMDQQAPTVASLTDGGFVVAWQSTDPAQDGDTWAVKAQRFDSAGAKVGSEFLVNTVAFGSQNNIDVAGLSNGGFVVTWQTSNGASADIFARAFSAGGTALGPQFQVDYDYQSQIDGRVAALPGGGFVVTWWTGGGTVQGIRAAIYDSTATKVGSEFTVNTTGATNGTVGAYKPDVAVLTDGTFVVSWDYTGGIRAQQVSATGQKIGSELTIATQASTVLGDSSIAALSGGGFVVAWDQSPYSGGTGFDIQAQRYLPDTTPNAAPELGAPSLALSRPENATAVMTVLATDDNGPGPLTYSIYGGADASLFYIDSANGLRFIQAPNFEAPADFDRNNVYEVVIRASDGALADTQALSITVTDVNDAPVITSNGGTASVAIAVPENFTAVTTVHATDAENSPITYSISGGNDATRFTINATTGVLSFIAAPDYEAPVDSNHDNQYLVNVRASDGSLTATQLLFVYVNNLDEAPVITSNGGGATAAISLVENGLSVTTVRATDPENAALVYSISAGVDAARFTIDSSTGALRFVASPNYEAPTDSDLNNVYLLTVKVSDGFNIDTQALSITVINLDEAPVITSNGAGAAAAISLAENGTAVTTVVAVDQEHGAITYGISGGADSALFAINASTGVLTFLAAPNYEAPADANGDNVYLVTVKASDGFQIDTQALSVTVTNVNEALVIGSNGGGDTAVLTVAENGMTVTTVAAVDPEHGTIAYSISGGADAAMFGIDGSTGILSFLAAPNYESPADANADNVYQVNVQASDGTFTDTQALSVTVSNVVEGIAITSNGGGDFAIAGVDENQTAVTTVTALNGENGGTTFAIAGGADAALFAIDPASGVLSFLAAPDFEAPADSGLDNVYDVIVSAGNGTFTDTQALAVTVFDVADTEGVFEKPNWFTDPGIGPIYFIHPDPVADPGTLQFG